MQRLSEWYKNIFCIHLSFSGPLAFRRRVRGSLWSSSFKAITMIKAEYLEHKFCY